MLRCRGILDVMNYQLGFIVALILLVTLLIWHVIKITKLNKLLANYFPMKSKCEKLAEENSALKLKYENEPVKKDNKKSDKQSKKNVKKEEHDSPVVSELNDKIKSLKEDNARLKERNYSLSKDNETLRKDVRANVSSSELDQRELLDLREAKEKLSASLDDAQGKIAALEKKLSDNAEAEKNAPQQPSSTEDVEKITALEKQKISLEASLKDVRSELASMKRDFKDRLEAAKTAAKNEVADSSNALKKELNDAVRSMQQAKKRADNNHKIYLIARAQMLLAEQRLSKLDADYKPIVALPVGNDAIDDVVKKFMTMDARENRASADVIVKEREISELNERIRLLEADNEALTNQTSSISLSSLNDGTDDSLSELVNNFKNKLTPVSEDEGIKLGSSAQIDFSGLDDDWDL